MSIKPPTGRPRPARPWAPALSVVLGLAAYAALRQRHATTEYRRVFGPVRGTYLATQSRLLRRNQPAPVAGRPPDRPLCLRVGTADLKVFRQVITKQHYDVTLPSDVRTIVDAGANIGLSAVWFADRYPTATVLAVEPEPGNYELLLRNTAAYPNIRCLCAAVSDTGDDLEIANPGASPWAFRVTARDASNHETTRVRGVTVGDLIDELGVDRLDVLKMDIEGSELEVFAHPEAWIDRVDHIVAELHDRFRPGCSRTFFDAVRDFPFEESVGDNVHVGRSDPRSVT